MTKILSISEPSPSNHQSTGESGGKRRSRKSQPQRVVVEAEDTVIDLDADDDSNDVVATDLQLVQTINGDHLNPQLLNKQSGEYQLHKMTDRLKLGPTIFQTVLFKKIYQGGSHLGL